MWLVGCRRVVGRVSSCGYMRLLRSTDPNKSALIQVIVN